MIFLLRAQTRVYVLGVEKSWRRKMTVNERHRCGVFSLYFGYSIKLAIHGKKYDILKTIRERG